MPEIPEEEIKQIMGKYKKKLKEQLDVPIEKLPKVIFSREYKEFKAEYMPGNLTIYEKLCNFSEKILKVKVSEKRKKELEESISIAHLNITPTGATSFSLVAPLIVILLGSLISFILTEGYFFIFFFFLIGLLLMGPLAKLPNFIANNWRMKASNQMVLCIFYIVTYMRHTSNLELAINFASEHINPPLSLDLKKVLWDVETEKYDSIKESLDIYLETWRKYNLEFIEAFNLIEGSLYEGVEDRRIELLDKSLDVILTGTYEKMLHYAHDLKSPITMLHMLGVIMPILGLVILPLIVSFMEGVKWYHIAALYNVLLPVGVYYLGRQILSKRPTGYGETDVSEYNPELKKLKNVIINFGGSEIKINPLYVSVFIIIIFLLIGFSPIIIHALNPTFDIETTNFQLLEYRTSKADTEKLVGPYGLGASILTLFITMALGLGLGVYWRLRSKNVIKIRENTKKLEKEFASAIFQLGNRLGDGLPAEIAFGKVASTMEGTFSGNFFSIVNMNIRKLGMGVKQAIFDKRTGALTYFPSNLIESSMKVLIESVKKGPKVAAQALLNISRYVKEIHKVNERLRDLMAEIISSMKSQIKFLTPAISGIVVGITSMITTILGKLGTILPEVAGGEAGGAANLAELFGDSVPTYYFQIVVGVYVIQIIYILTILANGIENGSDKLSERYNLGVNLTRSTLIYVSVSLIVTILFNYVASTIMMRTLV